MGLSSNIILVKEGHKIGNVSLFAKRKGKEYPVLFRKILLSTFWWKPSLPFGFMNHFASV